MTLPETLPPRPNLEWLRKTAKQYLQDLRRTDPGVRLSAAQLAIARHYGFASWRGLKAHVDRLQLATSANLDERADEFLRAVGQADVAAVRTALEANPALVNCVGAHPFWGGRPQPLHVAIETGREDVVALLLTAGADVNGSNDQYDHWTPLMLTLRNERSPLRELLLARGARIGLAEALLMADDALVGRLLTRGQRALPKTAPNLGSMLAFARTPWAIDRLLELGVPSEQRDRWGSSPIEALSRLGPRGAHLVAHLLERGIQAQPQEYARMGDQQRLAELIRVQSQIAHSDEVMMGAVDFGHRSLVTWLLQQGANVNARASNASHCTALHSAAWNGDLEMVTLLVSAGADLTARDDEHRGTARDWAAAAIQITHNQRCRAVAEYLRDCEVQRQDPPA